MTGTITCSEGTAKSWPARQPPGSSITKEHGPAPGNHADLRRLAVLTDQQPAADQLRALRKVQEVRDPARCRCLAGAHYITDGKATEVWTYPGDQYASDEFWA